MINNTKIDIKSLNQRSNLAPTELIELAERNYFLQIKKVSNFVVNNKKASIMLLAGPSASSKTTTAQKLSEELLKNNIKSIVISLDDFYINRNDLPLLPSGEVDYESIDTLDLEKLSQCFGELINDKKSELPVFDFTTGCRSKLTRTISTQSDTMIIMEGLHALNPIIMNGYDKKNFLKLYICPTSDYCIDGNVLLSANDIRFVRRAIRDNYYRSSPISKTFDMWDNVLAAELETILPFKSCANFVIDSTVIYEPNIYAKYFLNLANDRNISQKYEEDIKRLINAMKKFEQLPLDFIPESTVLKEFLPEK